jgi:hypothetical protein
MSAQTSILARPSFVLLLLLLMIFLHQASEQTIQSLVRACWLNALGATVNQFTNGISIGHFVMTITGSTCEPRGIVS